MKPSVFYLLILCTFALLTGCEKEAAKPTNELIGTWRLSEVYGDPGDGSGTFEAVQSNKRLTFLEDSTLIVNGNLCGFSLEADTTTMTTYDPTNRLIDTDCNFPFSLSYEQTDEGLVLSYPCIESCLERYVKVDE